MSVCPPCLVKALPELEQFYLSKCLNLPKFAPFIKAPYKSFFGSSETLAETLTTLLQSHPYIAAFQLDRQGCKSNIYKKVGSSLLHTFYTV